MRRVLLLFTSEGNKDSLIKSAKFLKENYGYEIRPVYVRDVQREEIIPTSVEGMVLDPGSGVMLTEWENLERDEVKHIQESLSQNGLENTLGKEIGFVSDVVKELLKEADVLILNKGDFFSENLISILKNQYKPIIMVGKNPLNFKTVAIATDDGTKINKSATNFCNLFENIETFTMISWNYKDEDNHLMRFLREKGKTITFENYQGDDGKESFYNRLKNFDLVVIGNLSRSYLFEKITRRKGINIIENAEATLFIG